MNAEQRKQIQEGIEIAKALTGGALEEAVGKSAEVIVRFAAPKGDGHGVKRWEGDLVDTLVAMSIFCAMLYMDGGHVLDISMRSGDRTRVIEREEWETSVGLVVSP